MGKNKKSIDIIITSILMLIFGIGEFVVVISVSLKDKFDLTSFFAISLGLIYIICGILLFTKNTWSIKVILFLLSLNIIIRLIMLFTKLYPTNTQTEMIGFIIGISFVLIFMIYIIIRRKAFFK